MPIAFSDEEKDLLLALAAPIDQRYRHQFLLEVTAAIEASGQAGVSPGPGGVHRVARTVQRKFWDPPQEIGEPRHDGQRQAAR
jgi:hypothetical protein